MTFLSIPGKSRAQQILTAAVASKGVGVEGNTEAGLIRNGEVAVGIKLPGRRDDLVDVGGAGEVFDEVGAGEGAGEVEVGGEADGRIPAVRHEFDAVFVRHPGDLALFADAADLGDI